MGGKSGGDVVVGFRYFMGVQLVGCHGPIDKLKRIIVGEREAWSGEVTTNGTIQVDKPKLFGGDSREGGVKGQVDVLMGGPTQGRNDYLATHQGVNCSAYRGVFSLVFRQFMWSSGNPYFKSPWLEVTRILKGWDGDNPWHPELAVINDLDVNPAHIIYQAMTDPAWGMGYAASDMDETEWLIAAQKLYNEGFGLSIAWDQQTDIESFVQLILNHINGSIGVNLSTGKFRLRLIRDDYDINTLTELNVDNVLELKSFQRAAFGDSANEVVVQYVDRDQKDASIAVQDLASIQAQGAVISSTQSYPGIRDAALAARVGLRDLRVLSSPLAKVVLTTNRVLWDKDKGDVVKFVWPLLGINGAAFRIIDIDKGTLADGTITVTMVEDIFGLPNNSYAATPMSQWVDTLVPPIAVNSSKVVEASYWDVIHNVKQSDMKTLVEAYGFGLFMASRGSVRSTLSYILAASPDDDTYREIGTGYFNPVGNLIAPLDRTTETFTLTGAFDLDNVVLSSEGGYAYIDSECLSVLSVDPLTGVVVTKRGILDTVPSTHVSGAKVFFVGGSSGYDKTERVSGETVYYKPLPSTGLGTLDLSEATTRVLTLNNRASRPYPPGNLRVDGQLYPSSIVGPAFTVTWAHRDRTAQTVDFVDYSVGNIGPEQGVSYRVRVFNGATLLRAYDLDGTTTSWSYPSSHDSSDGNIATLTVSVSSVRDGLESLYSHSHTFQRQVSAGSVGIEGPPAAPVISADSQAFAINVTWVLGDGRTNINYAEIRVSDTPDINHSTVLQYVDYPTMEYLHEIGTALTFKWYWVRVADLSGQLSEWSNLASGRSTSAAVTPQAILDAIVGQIDQTSLSSTLAARIDLIDAPGTGLGDRVDALDALTATTAANVSALSSDVATLLGTAEYSPSTTYDIGDMSRYNGYVYRAIQVTTNHLPTDTSYWELVGEYSSLGEIVAAHTAEINTLSSDLASEVTARETLASQSSAALTAAITSEATTRANADSALSTSITNVSAVANAKNKTFSQTTAPAAGMGTGDLWFDTDDNNKPYRYSGSAWVATDDARIAANAAAITSEATTRANADSALSTSITNLVATVNTNKSDATSAIAAEASARASADSAIATSVTTIQSRMQSRPNLLPNADFSNGMTGWQQTGGLALTAQDTTWGRVAQSTVTYSGTGTLYYQNIPVVAGSYYTLSGDSLFFATSGYVYFDLIFYDAGNNVVLDGPQGTIGQHDYAADDSNRSVHAVEVLAPANAVKVNVRFVVANAVGATAIGCRNIKLERGRLPYTPFTNEASLINAAAAIQTEQVARATADSALASSVTTLQASLTGGVNLLTNAGFDYDLTGWVIGWESTPADDDGLIARDLAAPDWCPVGMHTVGMTRAGTPAGSRDFGTGIESHWIPAEPGQRYCASAYLAAHRCTVDVRILFFTEDRLSWTEFNSPSSSAGGGKSLVSWDRKFVFATAPSDARYIGVFFRQSAGLGADPYSWVCRPMLERATTSQTQPSPWSPSVEGLRSSIQTQATAIAGLSAQYTVKVDVNGYVSGFGLASEPVNGVPFSEFAVLANNFKFGSPDGLKTPFSVVDVGGGVYKTVLNSDVLIGGNVDIANLKSGSLANNVILRLGGGVVELDGAGEIRVFKDTQPNADFVRLSAGEIRFLRYIAGSYKTYNYLSRLESGVANSGDTVVIPGYWKSQPRVMVSPAILSLYKKDYSNQDQAINCEAKNITEVPGDPGRWQFDAAATLNLAAASGGGAISLSSGTITSDTYTTTTQTTPGNCSNITPSLSVTSVRGNGASQYFRRTVRWRVEYYNGSTWVAGSWNNVAIGDQLGTVVSSALFTFPSAGTWQWRIAYEGFDTDTSVFGSITYTYTEHTVTAPDIAPAIFTTLPTNGPGAVAYPTYGIPGGTGEIYEIVYTATPKIEARVSSGSQSLYAVGLAYNYSSGTHRTVNGSNGNHQNSGGTAIATGKVWTYLTLTTTAQTYQPGTQTQTITGSNLTFNNKFWSLGTQQTSSLSVVEKLTLTGISAVVKRRTPVANSTTPANTFVLSSYTYSLSSAQVLATGSMNWMAVGE